MTGAGADQASARARTVPAARHHVGPGRARAAAGTQRRRNPLHGILWAAPQSKKNPGRGELVTEQNISNLSHEDRVFEPPADLAANANVKAEVYEQAAADRVEFWGEQAERLSWGTPFTEVLDWSNPPFAKWFVGGKLNAAYNCVDRHVEAGNGDKVALHFVGEPETTPATSPTPSSRTWCRQAANALIDLGVQTGDRVAIYLPMIPEAVIAMLACARLGAPHTVVFGGFSADALSSRILDCEAKVVITADGGYRRGAPSALKPAVDEALQKCPDVDRCARRTPHRPGRGVDRGPRRVVARRRRLGVQGPHAGDVRRRAPALRHVHVGHDRQAQGHPAHHGRLPGAVAYTFWAVFDHKPDDVYWCTADVGWVTGHSYIVYGPLANGATQVLYEGTPDTPHKGRWWEIIAEVQGHAVLHRADRHPYVHEVGRGDPRRVRPVVSLRILGSVGESINPEAYVWYRENIGGGRTPIVDTWWQTETGAHMISPLPGVTKGKPGSAMTAIPGIAAEVVDDAGKPVEHGEGGYLVITEPWPSMLRTIWGDDDRYKETYWSRWPGLLLRRRRRPQGRRRRDLAARPRRRRHERLGPPPVDHRDRVGAGVAPQGRRGRRRRRHRRDHRAGRRRVRHPARVRRRRRRGDRRRAAQPRRQGDRRDRQATPDHDRPRAAQDPLRQDHAPAAPRRRREPRGRRRHDAGRHAASWTRSPPA